MLHIFLLGVKGEGKARVAVGSQIGKSQKTPCSIIDQLFKPHQGNHPPACDPGCHITSWHHIYSLHLLLLICYSLHLLHLLASILAHPCCSVLRTGITLTLGLWWLSEPSYSPNSDSSQNRRQAATWDWETLLQATLEEKRIYPYSYVLLQLSPVTKAPPQCLIQKARGCLLGVVLIVFYTL